ncbi:MAG: SDR family NAD(P)-dependent oxidoreductase, partial [Solirubrobacteraceae bacterium]
MVLTVFVTGASAGFGAAITRRFAADGATVFAAARRVQQLNELAHELEPHVIALALDVRDQGAVQRTFDELEQSGREIDVLVNNAGLAKGLEPAYASELSDWEQMVDTNCKGLMYCTRAILPAMVARRRGHVIN